MEITVIRQIVNVDVYIDFYPCLMLDMCDRDNTSPTQRITWVTELNLLCDVIELGGVVGATLTGRPLDRPIREVLGVPAILCVLLIILDLCFAPIMKIKSLGLNIAKYLLVNFFLLSERLVLTN